MGTNYYGVYGEAGGAHPDGHAGEVHLGKLSAGWLPTVPQSTFDEWVDLAADVDVIVDEYGNELSLYELVGKFVLFARAARSKRALPGQTFSSLPEERVQPEVFMFRHYEGEFS